MPITIQPYQSQAGIRTASGGQAAQYRSASAFMAPGEENLGRGMQQLAAGVGKLGDTLFQAEIQRRQEQLELEAMEDVQNAFLQDEEWRYGYQGQFQGKDAANAAQDYAANSQKSMDALTEKFRHNPRTLEYVTSRMGSMRQSGVSAMRGYAEQQGKVYMGSLVAEQKNMLSSVYANPNSTPEERAQSTRDYMSLRHGQLVKEGWDPQAASSAVGAEIRAFDKDLERNRHAILRQQNPELASAISRAGVEGRVHIDPVAFVAGKESGKDGSLAIGYDGTGGTSYGKFQISSQTMGDSFIPWLEKSGHAAAAGELRNAGAANTGENAGSMADVWRALVQSGTITDGMQEQFIRETHLEPALKGIPTGFREAVAGSPILESAALSTAVQHGPGAAKKILAEAWDISEGDPSIFLAALYEERKTRFSSSTPEMRRGVVERLNAERDELYRAGNAVLEPTEWEPELRKDEAEIHRRQSEARKQGEALVGNLDNIKAFAIETGDFSKLNQAANELNAFGNHKAAANLREVGTVYGLAQPFLASVANAPFNERYAQIEELFSAKSPLFREDTAATIKEVRDMVTASVNKQREAFTRDPAGFVAQTQAAASSDEEGGGLGTPEQSVRANMIMQKVMGGPEFKPKPLTAEQANKFKAMLFDPDGDVNAKAEQLVGMSSAYGDLAPQVLSQVEANAGVVAATRLALDMGGDTSGAARMLLAAALTPDGRIPKNPDTDKEITNLIANSEYMQYMAAVMKAFPSRGGLPAEFRAVQDAAGKMIKIHGKESIEGLSAPYDFEADQGNRVYLRVPKQSGVDIDDAFDALQWIRRDMEPRFPGLTDENRQTMALKGVWRSSGETAVLSVDGVSWYAVPLDTAIREYKSAMKLAQEQNFKTNLALSGEGAQILAGGTEQHTPYRIPTETIEQGLSLSGEGLQLMKDARGRAARKSGGGK